ncbi:hypothetical protein EV363DRAFT_1396396 [Boletus edulis]|uniref:Uncharacterized protein n=1 Tax=Boletus edulis BED1 TaxID=1328754 RepID=A0AAD4G697_BOLED|nr:hypothetical protein EV363DRAFT_1396396 [Boletus edulis]KAF8420737.1 hypothetical protein L210DRAFT_3654774 [Boletus edulis BED1]
MQITPAAIVVFAAALVGAVPQPRQNCPEATQFGVLSVSPTTVSAGDTLTVNADFSCAINNFGHIPQYTDYYIEVPVNNNGHEPPILLARRTLASGSTSDSFTVQVPDAYYFANAGYVVILDTTFPINGTNGIPYSVVGGIEAPITIMV